ncbi:hypothetical protein CBS101457_000945 [Exobasidium rhododendri]|nr:hypothetical protein CBS101457_000945 [Exobasidium rhododendri]
MVAIAAIVVGAIVGAVLFAFFAYKLYVKLYHHQHRRQVELPAVREPLSYASHALSPSGGTMTGTLYGDAYNRDSWKGGHSRASLASNLDKYGSESTYTFQNQQRASSQGLLAMSPTVGVFSADNSAPSSPMSPPTEMNFPTVMPSSATDGFEASNSSNALSSTSSTMKLKRSYAPSMKSSAAASTAPTYRRDSYLPHLPENRDQIQITPPQPLGFGLGGMATAVDQKTLAFSSTSGIGGTQDDFTRGLIWHEGNPETAAQLRASKVGEEGRSRYLAQGPVRTMSPAAMRGAVHNHLYTGSNAGSSGMRTPEIPSSRSRSPAQVGAWDGSSASDVGPSVSQRGTIPPSQQFTHPLEASNNSSHSHSSQTARSGAFTSQQSPLGMMGGGGNSEGFPAPIINSIGTPNHPSPILGAFRNPAQGQGPPIAEWTSTSHSHSNSANSGSANSGYQHGERTPGLMSGSVSTENESGSAPLTDGSDRQSATDIRLPQNGAVEEERRIAIGKDGRLEALNGVGLNDVQPPKAEGKRQSKGWRLGSMLGSKV